MATEELRRYTKPMTCRLNDDELRQYGDDLARTLEEIDDQALREDSIKKELKARMSELESKRTAVAIKVRRREELRDVEVAVVVLDSGVAQEVRLDTGEVITTRPLRDDEKQRLLALEEAKKAEAATAAEHVDTTLAEAVEEVPADVPTESPTESTA